MQDVFEPPAQLAELIWAAVDFDGTVCESTWSPENPNATPGPPIKETVDEMWRIKQEKGMKIVIHTSRSWADYNIIEAYLNFHGIPFDRIVCGKLLARIYVDDRNVLLGTKWV